MQGLLNVSYYALILTVSFSFLLMVNMTLGEILINVSIDDFEFEIKVSDPCIKFSDGLDTFHMNAFLIV